MIIKKEFIESQTSVIYYLELFRLPGLEYVFRVSAVNDVGTSEPLDTGAPVLIKCQFDTPSAPRGHRWCSNGSHRLAMEVRR